MSVTKRHDRHKTPREGTTTDATSSAEAPHGDLDAEGDSSGGEVDSGASGGSAPAPRRRTARVASVVGIFALIGAVLLAGLGWHWHRQTADLEQQDNARSQASAAAEQAAQLLLRLDAKTGDQTLKELRELAGGDFAEQVNTLADTVAGVLAEGKVESQGDVASVAVEKSTNTSATVIVAATSLVSNSELPKGELRTFRMAIEVGLESGAWKVTNVEFLS